MAEDAAEVRKVVTVVFSDLVGSTALGERLDPETLRRVMARYFAAMQAALEQHGGTVEKFIGDAIMAVFGVPTVHEDDALRAVRAALAMREALARVNEELEREHGCRLETRTGVNTGEVVTGDASSAQKLATGDAVNVAARLEQAAGPGEILIGEGTHRLVVGAVEAEPLPPFRLPGKAEAAVAWRLVGVDAEGASTRPDSARLVGREQELRALLSAFEAVEREGSCALATVVGPPGIGKSRLARELAATIGARATVAVGRCLAYGEGITYAPLVEVVAALEDAAGPISELIAGADDGSAIASRVGAALGRSEARVPPEEIAWAFRRLFEAAGRARPLLLVLDDVHWAEPTLLDLVEYVAGFASGSSILILCLARPDLFEERPSWAAPRPNATLLALEPLSDTETEGLIEQLGAVDDAVRERIVATAEGNPLFVEHIVALQADDLAGGIVVPPTIQAVLAARIDRLEPEERAVLGRAAVEGRRFHRGAVASLLPAEAREDLGGRLLALIRKDLLRPDRTLVAGDDGFRFAHALIRDAAYGSLPKQLRAELHERYARWLAAQADHRHGEIEEIVGFHLEQAWRNRVELGPPDEETALIAREAGEHLWTAAREASARMEFPAAAALYERSVALWPDEPTGGLLQELLAAVNRDGDDDRAREVAPAAIERARRAGNRLGEMYARLDAFWIPPEGIGQRQHAAVGRAVEGLLPELEALGDDLGLTKALQLVALADHMAGRHQRAENDLRRALGHALALRDRLEESDVRVSLLEVYYAGPMPVDDAIAACERQRAALEARNVEAAALARSAGLHAMKGQFERARDLLGRSIAICEEFGILSVNPTPELFDVEMLSGDYAAAEAILREAESGFRHLQHWWGLGFAIRGWRAVALSAAGRYEEAEELTRTFPADATDHLSGHVAWRRARATALAHLGRLDDALDLAGEAVALAEETDALNLHGHALLDRGEVLRAAGRGEQATLDTERALGLFERKGNLVMAERIRTRAPLPG